MTGENQPTTPPATRNPKTLVWAVRLLQLECAGLLALTAYLVVLDLITPALQVAMAAALTVFAALAAVSVFVVARGLGRRARGARGPAIVVQLLIIAAGGFLLQTGPAWQGLVLMALGLVVGLLIVLPASTRALGID